MAGGAPAGDAEAGRAKHGDAAPASPPAEVPPAAASDAVKAAQLQVARDTLAGLKAALAQLEATPDVPEEAKQAVRQEIDKAAAEVARLEGDADAGVKKDE